MLINSKFHKKMLGCFAYIMHENRPLGIPTKRYIEICLEGYSDFGFDENILLESVKRTGELLWKTRK